MWNLQSAGSSRESQAFLYRVWFGGCFSDFAGLQFLDVIIMLLVS